MKVYVYALKDPETERVFYVGRTKRHPRGRYLAHIAEANRYAQETMTTGQRLWGINASRTLEDSLHYSNIQKLRWIVSIQQRGLKPSLEVLDEGEFDLVQDAARFEEAWIAEMRRQNQPLTNYIYSHRMSPAWYGPSNPKYQEGWAKTPMEYIKALKSGEIGGYRTKTEKPRKPYNRTQLRRLSKKAHRSATRNKHKKK